MIYLNQHAIKTGRNGDKIGRMEFPWKLPPSRSRRLVTIATTEQSYYGESSHHIWMALLCSISTDEARQIDGLTDTVKEFDVIAKDQIGTWAKKSSIECSSSKF